MVVIYLLVLHFVADFVLQSRKMGKKKSESVWWLIGHMYIQFGIFMLGLLPLMAADKALMFATANALIHGLIDWNVWKLYKYSVWKRHSKDIKSMGQGNFALQWKYWEDHWFYLTIGFDQLLHGATLVGLWHLL